MVQKFLQHQKTSNISQVDLLFIKPSPVYFSIDYINWVSWSFEQNYVLDLTGFEPTTYKSDLFRNNV